TGFNDTVQIIAPQTDGKIMVGGSFISYNGVTENGIIRLNADGSKDATFVTGTGFNDTVQIIAPQTDGKILVGGYFYTYNGNNGSANLIGLHSGQSLATENFHNSNSFTISPNPVKDFLHIQSNDFTAITSAKIYDLQGKLIQETTTTTIPVSSLAKGLYIVKVKTENAELSKKFIKE
ncbi:MAG: T9SS type A sorting domain-containing protein, partial [Limnohabitans sp.]|nr:T9SS type A sorting domain-containing protein [Limnohabitans sp.]